MIQVDGLSIAYQGHPLFEGAVFSIQEGERCGLVGRNGSGKSTLFRLLTGKEQPDKGSIHFRKNYIIGALDQHIVFNQKSVIDEAATGLRPEDKDKLYKAEMILFGLGFKDEDLDRSPHELSGGYHLRLHLAKVLISEPDCLLLDEPTNYLDIVSIRWFEKFLKNWKGEFILISHDREFMDAVTSHTMGIHRNKVKKFKGGTVPFFEQIFQEEEIHEKTRVNLEKKKAQAQEFIDRFGAKASKATQAQSKAKLIQRIPVLEKLKGIHNLDFHFNEAFFPGKKMLEAQHVSFSYPQSDAGLLINDFSLTLEKGEKVAIIGKNGRGKSTLLRLLANDLKPLSGEVSISENLRIGYFGQTNIDRLNPKHTVYEEISIANPKLSLTEVKSICGVMMFSGSKSEKSTSVLSGGEKSRVLLGKILASPCNLLILDEPTHHLDMESIEALIDALEDFKGSLLLVTHSELILKRMALDKIVLCGVNTQQHFIGTYEDFLDKNGWEEEQDQGKSKKKGNELKDLKQQKADLINARSKALKPFDKEMQELEKLITKLEIEQQKAQAELVELAQKGEGRALQELSQAIAVRNKTLNTYYQRLSEVTQKHEECSAGFNGKIDSLH